MIIRTLGRLRLFLKSKKLAVFLISIITFASIIGMLDPKADRVFSTWWFLLISFAFLINLLSCTLEQGFKAWRIWKERKAIFPDLRKKSDVIHLKLVRETFEKGLSQKGFRIICKEENITLFEKGCFGIWGSSLLHIGLIIVLLGGLISAGFKMTGYMSLMEGEVRQEIEHDYDVIDQAPLFKLIGHRGYGIALIKQNRILNKQGKVDYLISNMTLFADDKPVIDTIIEEGKPLVYKGLGIYEKNAGFVPLVTITDSGGKEIYKGFLFMETSTGISESGASESIYQRKGFSIPGTTYAMNILFYPDILIVGNKISTRKFSLGDSGMEVTVDRNGQELAHGVIKTGDKVTFDGYTISFGEVRQWLGTEIVYDPGAGILFLGFWVTGIGLIIYFLFRYKKLQVSFITSSDGLQVGVVYHCLRNRKMFIEEITDIIDKLNS